MMFAWDCSNLFLSHRMSLVSKDANYETDLFGVCIFICDVKYIEGYNK